MKCQAKDEKEGKRAWFEIEGQPDSVGVKITIPSGEVFYLVRSQVEAALGCTSLETIIKEIRELRK